MALPDKIKSHLNQNTLNVTNLSIHLYFRSYNFVRATTHNDLGSCLFRHILHTFGNHSLFQAFSLVTVRFEDRLQLQYVEDVCMLI